MGKRVNFDVSDETTEQIEQAMAVIGARSQRSLFLRALNRLLESHRLVHDEKRMIVAVRSERWHRVSKAADDAIILEQPKSPTYRWLIDRPGDWRATPWIKGARLHVSDIMAMVAAEPDLAPEKLAEDLHIPMLALDEAFSYIAANRDLIEAEEREAAARIRKSKKRAPASR